MGYMVSSWGGYVFLINLIPLHVLILMIAGRFSHRIYIAYSTVYTLGTLLSMQISFVGFQPVQTSEHMLALGVFGLCQILAFVDYLRANMSKDNFNILFKSLVIAIAGIISAGLAVLTLSGKVAPWTGRFYSLLDPSYAKNNIPIIASVSEEEEEDEEFDEEEEEFDEEEEDEEEDEEDEEEEEDEELEALEEVSEEEEEDEEFDEEEDME